MKKNDEIRKEISERKYENMKIELKCH